MSRPPRPLVIAHRGASGHRPENTGSAFRCAIEQRSDMIETDLHRCRDGAIVIRHDEELETLGGRADIGDCDLDEIRALDAGGGEPIPTLDEILDDFGAEIPFNLELKSTPDLEYPHLEADAVAAVERRGWMDRTLFSAFRDGVLRRLREASADARLAVLLPPRHPERAAARAAAVGAEAVNPWLHHTTRELVDSIHAEGLAVYVYTVIELADMERLIGWGVDGMFTNYPDRLRSLI